MMSIDHNHSSSQNQSNLYQIKLKGSLEVQNSERFEGFSIILDVEGNTLLIGTVIDQASLYGLLKKIRDLGLTLISICPGKSDNLDLSISKMRSNK
jgi:hypothetical protein